MEITRSSNAITVTGEVASLRYVIKRYLVSGICYLFFIYQGIDGWAEWRSCELEVENGYNIDKNAYETISGEYPDVIGLHEISKAVLLACSTN